jgi:DNA-binding NtrC family response regulator
MSCPGRTDLLIVDDDDVFRETAMKWLERKGYVVHGAASAEEALRLADQRQFSVAIVDMVMPGLSGHDLLRSFKESDRDCEVILLTGQGTIEAAVAAMKLGAFDFVTKPCSLAVLETLVERARERGDLRKENVRLKEALRRAQPRDEIVGASPPMREVFRLIERVGPTDKPVLIQGESGTGKELVARAIHQRSVRAERPLVVINCAALPDTLLESELFGHEKGAFTGAVQAKAGLFELADSGTLFIDEIGEMSGALQAKLLRVLEDGTLRRIGSLKERRVDVRLIAATNRNMAEEVNAGRFREDLYYRINVMSLQLPPLRQRSGDLPLLLERFLRPGWTIEPEALEALARCTWPGNVRQLKNALERAEVMSDDATIRLLDLPPEILVPATSPTPVLALPAADGDELSQIERAHVQEILARERGNKARAARALGINRRSLYRLIEKYDIRIS